MNIQKKADGFDLEKMFVLSQDQLGLMAEHPLIKQAYITDIGYYPKASNHFRERLLGTEAYIIIYCVRGKGWFKQGSEAKIEIKENTYMVIPSGTPHSYGADEVDPWSIYWFHLKGEQIEHILQSSGLRSGSAHLQSTDAEKLIDLFHLCYDLLSAGAYTDTSLLHVSHAARYMISYLGLMQKLHKEEKSQAYFDRAVLYMQQMLEMSLSLDELADQTGISKQHLNHVFRNAAGISPIDYYLRMKMQRACQLLDLTDNSVKEIGLSIGIGDPFYFSRLFKKMIGRSPTEYRSQLRG
ncbi:helix-turn-helix domain-containing protein [Candidatus Pristimantibacillus sp. PTI5]|uniref:AraC family transcriptional regulator n=1 Tax=Candidatus Pristimantibacillus sp. PTI5 TaxID=3400422 RepID=UPI003B013107